MNTCPFVQAFTECVKLCTANYEMMFIIFCFVYMNNYSSNQYHFLLIPSLHQFYVQSVFSHFRYTHSLLLLWSVRFTAADFTIACLLHCKHFFLPLLPPFSYGFNFWLNSRDDLSAYLISWCIKQHLRVEEETVAEDLGWEREWKEEGQRVVAVMSVHAL